ncbi:hypothetical protein WA1_07950 [Scytonema hofmannii PCC 7110]|uniref:Uncharacterized protein n=1 Tax=Scytonema hofmannii PCC 7110 TaxID=128403 RepID=A0A139WTJ0_9CYAN|nr:hypothetical protein [Scytonema hofmannii]KYC35727.1 hypothetical protein WA1_07950 [Scytonema hofmannii PCC 7110]
MSVNNYDQKKPSEDFLVDQAIVEGQRQATEVTSEPEMTLEFSDEQSNMLGELTSALTLSGETLLESAISYVHYKYKKNQNFAKKIEEDYKQHTKDFHKIQDLRENSSKQRSKLTRKLILSAVISHKLEEMGMTEKINECVLVGINLLYEQLTKNK